jgi:hypothetical protein
MIVSVTPTSLRKSFWSHLAFILYNSLMTKRWNSSLTACGACLVTALSAQYPNPDEPEVPQPSTLPAAMHQDITDYCAAGFGIDSPTETLLYNPGFETTLLYFSQILLYNMTVFPRNSTIPGLGPPGPPSGA